ncbi:ammonium transporter 1 member 1 [Nephila pilipes]|uniref:Ammonium transporter 1 member 1 n=1 Tax=Nephila pilipes TaxID=299642 RepID=A0A8X6PUC9_NEPPI|nr:ammonium transporter 1 member 1 [Nephila pilipes]
MEKRNPSDQIFKEPMHFRFVIHSDYLSDLLIEYLAIWLWLAEEENNFYVKDGIHDVPILMNAVMGSLVAISGGCTIVRPWEALVIGMVAALLVLFSIPIIDSLHIDDPTNTFAVHGVAGAWGMLAIGLFSVKDNMRNYTRDLNGLFKGGGWKLIGIQAMSCGILFSWSILVSSILLYVETNQRKMTETKCFSNVICRHKQVVAI